MPFRCFALLSGSREIFIATGSPIDPLLHDRSSSSSSLFHSFFFPLFLFPFFPFSSFLFARLVLVDATGQRDGNRVPSTTLFLISAAQLSRSTKREAERVYRNRLHRPPSIDPGNSNSNRLESNNAKLGSQNLCPSPFRVLFGRGSPFEDEQRAVDAFDQRFESNDILTIPPRSSREICTYKQFCSYIYILGTNGRLYLEPRISRETLSAEKEEK